MSTASTIADIGVGIDTARYGHRVWFLRPDRQPAAKPITVTEDHDGYQLLRQQLEQLQRRHPQAHFHIHIDAAGQYAANLEQFLRGLDLPITVSIGEPKRNKDYQKAHFPKRTTDDTESQAMARFAVVEQPSATPAKTPQAILLHEVAIRLQAQVKLTTRTTNRLHNLMARVFPELATIADDFSARWVLLLLDKYPTAERIARAHPSSLEKVPHLRADKVQPLQQAAQQSVGSLRGPVAETLVRDLVAQLRHCQQTEQNMRKLLSDVFADLPAGGHQQLTTIPGIGAATAAVLTAKIIDIDRFASPAKLVGYFGVFPDEESSGVDKHGKRLPPGTLCMSQKGNDLVRAYLWNAALSAISHNPILRAFYHRLKADGKRGDVAMGHCMRKLLHLVFAVWKTDRPFDECYRSAKQPSEPAPTPTSEPAPTTTHAANEMAVGHKREVPAKQVVTTATASVAPTPSAVKPPPAPAAARPHVDFAFLRRQITLEQVLSHLGVLDQLRGSGHQRRGPCPLHGQADDRNHTFSVHLGKNVFQCFQRECAAHGNVLDFWAALQRLPLYEASLHLAETFQLLRNREEELVK